MDGRGAAREWRSLPLGVWAFVYLEANADLSRLDVSLMHRSPRAAALPEVAAAPAPGEEGPKRPRRARR